MGSKRDREGYFVIDNRQSPGMADEAQVAAGLPAGSGRGLFESATATCNHCQATVVLNPKRDRERGYCRKCDSYICDACEVLRARTFECKPFAKFADEYLEAAARQDGSETSLILLP
jgi:hypothetical protein